MLIFMLISMISVWTSDSFSKTKRFTLMILLLIISGFIIFIYLWNIGELHYPELADKISPRLRFR